jgi:SAM-dependent methyltransferase
MIESNNPEINVDELMQKIQEEIAQRQGQFKTDSTSSNVQLLSMISSLNNIETLLKNAESRAYIRSKWPDKFNRFPFNTNLQLQKIILKIINLFSKDQREVNFNLIGSLKESTKINKQLIEQITTIQDSIALHKRLTEQVANLRSQVDKICLQKRDECNRKEQEKYSLESFYIAFEERFRGSYEDITARLKVYLPLMEEAKVGTIQSPVLDLGCGRGEWIELLQNNGYVARGLELNSIAVKECQRKGFDVIESDAIAYLQSMPKESVGALTGFHIIEHLPFEALIGLFDEAMRVLVPGGLVIFETPNPQNVLVGSNTFYLDPTHLNPLPSQMIKFMAESRGLTQVKIIELHPYPENHRLGGSDVADRFSDYFYGPQDYAVVGYKL